MPSASCSSHSQTTTRPRSWGCWWRTPFFPRRSNGSCSRAAGNPLYAQEYVRMLVDRGFLRREADGLRLDQSEALPLPESIQGMIAARLDALPHEEKSLLQSAAVVGRAFWFGALAALSDLPHYVVSERLAALERKEFVRGAPGTGLRREPVCVPPRPRSRRRLWTDSTCQPCRQASAHGRVAGDAEERPGRPGGDGRLPLPERSHIRTGGRAGYEPARPADPPRSPRCRPSGRCAQFLGCGEASLRGRTRPVAARPRTSPPPVPLREGLIPRGGYGRRGTRGGSR